MVKSEKSKQQRWRFLVDSPAAYNPSSRPDGLPDSAWGRTWTLERTDGTRALVRVEASAAAIAAYMDGTLPQKARRAIQTEGRSAVEQYLGETSLPGAIHVTSSAVRRHRVSQEEVSRV
jgi:hypothetical protein